MVAPRKSKQIFCTVVVVPAADDSSMQANQPRFKVPQFPTRPSELLPWADPYISALVTKLQDEVRDERSGSRLDKRTAGTAQAELEPPTPELETDWQWREEPRWTLLDGI